MSRCKAIAQATGQRCQTQALLGEEFCIFHSKSEQAKKYSQVSRPKNRISREELLRGLTKDFRNLEKNEDIKQGEKQKLRAKLGRMVMILLDQVDRIDELEELARELRDGI